MAGQPCRQKSHKASNPHHTSEETPEQRVQQQPHNPFPAQHQEKPGSEAELTPRPQYRAPLYKGSDKLQKKVALITGGDSGIGRAVAVLYAREGADVTLLFLPEELADAKETQSVVEAEGRTALIACRKHY